LIACSETEFTFTKQTKDSNQYDFLDDDKCLKISNDYFKLKNFINLKIKTKIIIK